MGLASRITLERVQYTSNQNTLHILSLHININSEQYIKRDLNYQPKAKLYYSLVDGGIILIHTYITTMIILRVKARMRKAW